MRQLLYLLLISLLHSCQSDDHRALLVTHDMDRFWEAYDQMQAVEDSVEQLEILQEVFIGQASAGQQRLFEVRRYRPEEYVHAIRSYPKFYNSLRKNHEQRGPVEAKIREGLKKFRSIYPTMKPASIYMGVGVFRTNGTTVDSMVLFGSEMVMTDTLVDTSEFPDELQYFKNYIAENPIDNIGFLATHEFVHTQQREAMGTNLLSTSLREGSAELIAELAYGGESTNPAIHYTLENEEKVMERFAFEMYNRSLSHWLWTSRPSPFGHRDMGYAPGYLLSKKHYEQSSDKAQAIADLIELDYTDIVAVRSFVDQIGYYDDSMPALQDSYESQRPRVTEVERDGDLFTVRFSQPMDTEYRGFDYGPLGEEHVLRIAEMIGFSPDGRSISIRCELRGDIEQQMELTYQFRDEAGRELVPYVISTRE